jgi:aryl-alcohol dehydrogenase-like predicted oxidoreductase
MENDSRKTASVDALLAVAGEAGATPSQAALAWLTSRGIIPIIGPRTSDQLMDNLGAVGLALSSDQLARLDAASAVPLGFPLDFLAAAMQNVRLAGGHPEKIDKPISPAD